MYKLNDYVIPKVPKQLLTSQNRPQAEWQNVHAPNLSYLRTYCIFQNFWHQRTQILSTVSIANYTVTVQYDHICMHMLPDTCRKTIFLADLPVSMETSNYLTQKNNSRARGSTLTERTFLYDYSTVYYTSLHYTHRIWKTQLALKTSSYNAQRVTKEHRLCIWTVSILRRQLTTVDHLWLICFRLVLCCFAVWRPQFCKGEGN